MKLLFSVQSRPSSLLGSLVCLFVKALKVICVFPAAFGHSPGFLGRIASAPEVSFRHAAQHAAGRHGDRGNGETKLGAGDSILWG